MLIKRKLPNPYDYSIVFTLHFEERFGEKYITIDDYVVVEFNVGGKKIYVVQNEDGDIVALTDNLNEFIEDKLRELNWVKESFKNAKKLLVKLNGKVVKEVSL